MEILIAIILLSVLILIHELGHFLVARRAGILVEEFGIGLPPRIWGFRLGETLYSVNALPIGGFVRLHGESGVEETIAEPERAFFSKPLNVRLAVLLAGVAMNFLFGVALLAVLLTIGAPAAFSPQLADELTDRRVELVAIAPNSPAEDAGLGKGDRLLKVAAADEVLTGELLNVNAVRELVAQNLGEELTLQILRGGEEVTVAIYARPDPPANEGPLGIAMADVGTLRYPWYRSMIEAARMGFVIAGNTFAAVYFVLKEIIVEGEVSPGVAGPVGIVQIAGDTFDLGIIRFVNFAVILTINLAVLNILPIPALDGGRILFLAIERVRGKPISRKVEQIFHGAGMLLLIALILLITIHDIRRL